MQKARTSSSTTALQKYQAPLSARERLGRVRCPITPIVLAQQENDGFPLATESPGAPFVQYELWPTCTCLSDSPSTFTCTHYNCGTNAIDMDP